MTVAYVGVGANLDHAARQVHEAVEHLNAIADSRVVQCSSLYRTEPWGVTDQPPFINAVAALETALEPRPLLHELLSIEQAMGRVREQRWGPRRIDLDLLVHGRWCIDDATLTLPHPHLHERAFVLVPLAEIAPELAIPGSGMVSELLAAVDTSGVARWTPEAVDIADTGMTRTVNQLQS